MILALAEENRRIVAETHYPGAVIASLKTDVANCLQLSVKNLNELENRFSR